MGDLQRQQQRQQLAEQHNFERRVIAENVCNISPRNELGKRVKYFLRWLDTVIELGNYDYNIRNTKYPLQGHGKRSTPHWPGALASC